MKLALWNTGDNWCPNFPSEFLLVEALVFIQSLSSLLKLSEIRVLASVVLVLRNLTNVVRLYSTYSWVKIMFGLILVLYILSWRFRYVGWRIASIMRIIGWLVLTISGNHSVLLLHSNMILFLLEISIRTRAGIFWWLFRIRLGIGAEFSLIILLLLVLGIIRFFKATLRSILQNRYYLFRRCLSCIVRILKLLHQVLLISQMIRLISLYVLILLSLQSTIDLTETDNVVSFIIWRHFRYIWRFLCPS